MQSSLINLLLKIIKQNYDIFLDDIKLGVPPKTMFWDYSFNAGILSKHLKKNPNLVACELKGFLEELKNDLILWLEVSWAYLNIEINNKIYSELFDKIYKNRNNLLKKVWENKTIIVDYIWVNVWKPLHVWHICTPNIWQTIINIYKKLWYNVISDSHIWDWGIIFWNLIKAYKLWWDEDEFKKNAVDYLLELYVKINTEVSKDEKIEEDVRQEFKLLSSWNNESILLWEKFTKYSILDLTRNLKRLSVFPDYNIWESFYEGLDLPKMNSCPDLVYDMNSIVKELLDKSIATKNEDNSVWVIFPDKSWLSSCILQKRNGTHGYLASDLACIKYRMSNWNPEKIIYFVDVRQSLHFKQAFEISKNAWWLWDSKLIHASNWFIAWKDWIFSTRKWNIIKLDKILDEAENRAKKIILEKRNDLNQEELDELWKIIWIWAIKYWHLKKSRETDSIFDWDEFMSFEWNSGPYIQYAYVRAKKIINNFDWNFNIDTSFEFNAKQEIDLIKKLLDYENIILDTLNSNMPHILCKYCYELTKIFNSFYNNVHILSSQNDQEKIARLKLVDLFCIIIKQCFSLLAIEMPKKM